MAERMSSGDLTAGEVRFIRESKLDPTLIAKQMRMSPEEIVLIKERKLRNDVDSPTPMQEAIARVSAEESSRQTNPSHIEVVERSGKLSGRYISSGASWPERGFGCRTWMQERAVMMVSLVSAWETVCIF